MTDFKEQAERLIAGLSIFPPSDKEPTVLALATALSEMHEAGRREEREECAKVADKEGWEYDRLASRTDDHGLQWQHENRAEICRHLAAAIRSREVKP